MPQWFVVGTIKIIAIWCSPLHLDSVNFFFLPVSVLTVGQSGRTRGVTKVEGIFFSLLIYILGNCSWRNYESSQRYRWSPLYFDKPNTVQFNHRIANASGAVCFRCFFQVICSFVWLVTLKNLGWYCLRSSWFPWRVRVGIRVKLQLFYEVPVGLLRVRHAAWIFSITCPYRCPALGFHRSLAHSF